MCTVAGSFQLSLLPTISLFPLNLSSTISELHPTLCSSCNLLSTYNILTIEPVENRTGTQINWFGVSHIIVIKESRTDNLFLVPLKMHCRTWTMFLLNRMILNLCSGYDKCPVPPLKMHKISNTFSI